MRYESAEDEELRKPSLAHRYAKRLAERERHTDVSSAAGCTFVQQLQI